MIFILQKRHQITVSKNSFLTERKLERCHTGVAAFILMRSPMQRKYAAKSAYGARGK